MKEYFGEKTNSAQRNRMGQKPQGCMPSPVIILELDFIFCDPKGSDLYLIRLKSREILMEDHTHVDVQIAVAN